MSDAAGRRSGVLVPLFSIPSTSSWGIGDIGDIAPLTAWLAGARQRVLQLLPINEMAPGQQSPYSAISAMAIDPIFIDVRTAHDFQVIGGESSLPDELRQRLAGARASSIVDHAAVRLVKYAALRLAFARFQDAEWCRDTERSKRFKEFLSEQAWWIEDYALFRAIHLREGERPWSDWAEPLRRRDPQAIVAARRELAAEVRFFQYLQWIAHAQWRDARARTNGVALFGDLPFMVDGDSADVWARQDEFMLDVSLGVPPDAFSADGQDWGMPVYRWDVLAREGFRWLRERARRTSDLFDGFRIDHLVGFYRTYGRPREGGEPFFTPGEEREQEALGQRLIAIFREPGAQIIAEDLGIVPDFVRASLARLGVPGFRVFRWERRWHDEGQPFRDPAEYSAVSVATTGTHDTEPMAHWWSATTADERALIASLPSIQRMAENYQGGSEAIASARWTPAVRDMLLEVLFASGADLVLFPLTDVFGWRDRINEPGTVTNRNWTFRLPWPVDQLNDDPTARERQAVLRKWTEHYRRG
jgi:4-alpha-glucanotransferase